MAQNKKATLSRGAAKGNLSRKYSNDAAAQRSRVLTYLRRHGSLSTLDARHRLDCLHPAARVMELRWQGYDIATVWTRETTPEGFEHRVARYHLIGGRAA